jgi:hypothetical protein
MYDRFCNNTLDPKFSITLPGTGCFCFKGYKRLSNGVCVKDTNQQCIDEYYIGDSLTTAATSTTEPETTTSEPQTTLAPKTNLQPLYYKYCKKSCKKLFSTCAHNYQRCKKHCKKKFSC